MALISVVMGSYNHEPFLRESVSSILRQTLPDLELIIIDDASEDGSEPLLTSLARRDRRIRLIFHERNLGIPRTFNEGLGRAAGDYIALTASDDVWMSDKLEVQLRAAGNNHHRVIWSDALLIDSKGRTEGKLFTEYKNARGRRKSGFLFDDLLTGNYVSSQSLFFHRSRIRDIRFNEGLKYVNDYLFVLDLARHNEFLFIPEPLVKYRLHAGNTINRDVEGWRTDLIKFGHDILETYGEDLTPESRSHIYLSLASAYSKLGFRAESKACLKKALKVNPVSWRNVTAAAAYVKDGLPSFLNRNKVAPARKDLKRKSRELLD